ncbi:MAG: hypothetical protein N3E45_02320 [Oscillatoriaceae bacterium SKW80]|nr:hypothetical protein [Oscillatoriaceae bacterium SKYG93]MCX8119660.1 hypothetical protein [Oscillatoriaceae bacterium SKW80]MDW8455127.1 hypothetical protein [Oscillatoriaceae cyanobacterium SKYGB_i_bin93]HIK28099.1 hypothetical protein [Oscillatoriaceae cyanobacterium M7585_C2015_266]
MSQNTDMQPSVSSNENKPLNTTLQMALGSLDVQLEEELTRYRRHRRCEQLNSTQRKLARSATGEPDLIYVTASGGRTQPQVASAPETPIITLPEGTSLENLQANESKPQAWPATSPSLLLSGAEAAPKEITESNVNSEKNPEGYLESSEALLENLKPEETPKQTETNTDDSLLSPLGIGSMLLFLMASIIFGYVATNPAGLAHLGLGRFFNRQAPSATQKPAKTPAANENIAETQIATSPNLASQEFVELNLSTLSNLDPKANSIAQPEVAPVPTAGASPLPTVTIAPAPGVKSSSGNASGLKNLSSALLPQTNQSTKVSSSALKLPRPPVPAQPAKEAPTTTATISLPINPVPTPTPAKKTNTNAGGENFYYVVMEYEGEQSLEKARQVVADAYTREFPVGVRIQLGAFGDAKTAQVLVQELQRQGLPAQVYRP